MMKNFWKWIIDDGIIKVDIVNRIKITTNYSKTL